jgi:hypothetical protein
LRKHGKADCLACMSVTSYVMPKIAKKKHKMKKTGGIVVNDDDPSKPQEPKPNCQDTLECDKTSVRQKSNIPYNI